MSEIDRLVQELARGAGPVRRLWPRSLRFGLWLGAAAVYLGAGVLLLGVRPDLAAQLRSGSFLVQLALACATVVLSASSAFALSVPGAERALWTRFAPVTVLSAWIAWMLYRMVSFVADPRIWLSVIREYSLHELGVGLALSSVPGVLLFVMVRRAAPLRPGWAGGLALVAAGAIASAGALLTCDSPCPIHAVVLHMTPLLSVGAIGVGAGWLLLSRFR